MKGKTTRRSSEGSIEDTVRRLTEEMTALKALLAEKADVAEVAEVVADVADVAGAAKEEENVNATEVLPPPPPREPEGLREPTR